MKHTKGLVLLSGGIDSPVATWIMQKQGLTLEAIHFSNEPFTDDVPEKKTIEAAKLLGLRKLAVVNIAKPLVNFNKTCNKRYYFVFMKRLMYRIAQEYAQKAGATCFITGENLGQVSSQTLTNLSVLGDVAELPLLQPLLGYDKEDIIEIAKRIGTYEISKGPEHCDALGPKFPMTKATKEGIEAEESKLPLQQYVSESLQQAKIVEL